jgi:hypothetical protein
MSERQNRPLSSDNVRDMSPSEPTNGEERLDPSRSVNVWEEWSVVDRLLSSLARDTHLSEADREVIVAAISSQLAEALLCGAVRHPRSWASTAFRHEMLRRHRDPRLVALLGGEGDGCGTSLVELRSAVAAYAELTEWFDLNWHRLKPLLTAAEVRCVEAARKAPSFKEMVKCAGGSARGHRTLISRAAAKIRNAIALNLVPPPPSLDGGPPQCGG